MKEYYECSICGDMKEKKEIESIQHLTSYFNGLHKIRAICKDCSSKTGKVMK